MTSNDFILPQLVRALGHFASWARYRVAGETTEPSRPPARVTYPGSQGDRAESQCG
jgi:hypothetical protein